MIAKIPVALSLALCGSASLAQSSEIPRAIESGAIGERFDGYLGFVSPPSEKLRREVIGMNIQRRALYTQLATQRGVTTDAVGLTTGCTLLRQLPIGEAYLLKGTNWRRRIAGEPSPVPDYCR